MIPFPAKSAPASMPNIPCPGFADPVRDAQRCFRKVLAAISYPGRLQDLRGLLSVAPEPLYPTTAAVCLALFDVDTPVWLAEGMDTPEVRQFLSFHCGCPIPASPGEAAFAVLDVRTALPNLGRFHVGTPEYPDRAATLLIQTPSLQEGTAATGVGPGIAERQPFAVADLDPEFWQRRAAVNAGFPTGLDILFIDPRQLLGLPRTTRVEGLSPCMSR